MILRIAVISLIGTGFGILQTTLLASIMPMGVVVDLALLLLVVSSWRYGSLSGEISGFIIGIAFDLLSLAPLGFHAFLFSAIGYIFGKLHGNISPGILFLPFASALVATLIKHAGAALLSLIFDLNIAGSGFFTVTLALELAENAVFAPILFWIWSIVLPLIEGRRGGFQ